MRFVWKIFYFIQSLELRIKNIIKRIEDVSGKQAVINFSEFRKFDAPANILNSYLTKETTMDPVH